MYLLDTCTLIWLVSQQISLTEKVKKILKNNAGNLYISAISAFEIAIKTVKGKIELPLPPDEWFREAIRLHGIEEIPINSEIAGKSALLPGIHNDPCDRIIIATAIHENMIIITKDEHFSKYPGIRVVWE
ncbi:MAG TPA: type II toxin-antitoxin system VapC family toxin [Candidatus Deferrimicrobium sp.]|nr:type II toxin-antitoxin system VapC family toxin [Candidatus Kapabacteria bacterium]HLP58147.1 type II toxin-antitoxin system VapC family toxin [Candidatus Deferrimicrobium sp.]